MGDRESLTSFRRRRAQPGHSRDRPHSAHHRRQENPVLLFLHGSAALGPRFPRSLTQEHMDMLSGHRGSLALNARSFFPPLQTSLHIRTRADGMAIRCMRPRRTIVHGTVALAKNLYEINQRVREFSPKIGVTALRRLIVYLFVYLCARHARAGARARNKCIVEI
jgi:hypothetical protein